MLSTSLYPCSQNMFVYGVLQWHQKTNANSVIRNGLRKYGIYPFNPDPIDKTKLTPSLIPTSLNQLQCALNQTSSENENSIENSSGIPVAALTSTLVDWCIT